MSKILNQLIRKEIDKSAKLRNLIKDSEMSKQMSFKLSLELKEKDKKISFYKKLNKAMREVSR